MPTIESNDWYSIGASRVCSALHSSSWNMGQCAMYPIWMNNLLLCFDLWGFSTQFRTSRNQRKLDLLILTTHTILASIATSRITIYLLRPVNDQLGTFNDILKFSALIFLYWISLIELYFKRKIQRKFWECVCHIDQHLCSHQQIKLTSYLNRIKIYFLLSALAYLLYLERLLNNTGSKFLIFWLSYIFMCLVFQIRSFYYLFFLDFIKHELKMIDLELAVMLNDCRNVQPKRFRKKHMFLIKFHRKRFKWIRQYYDMIYNLCRIVNNVFGWSNVIAILLIFHLILTDINWFYWKLLNKYQFNIHGNRFYK